MKVDDYGCFYADSRLLKANLYPLMLDTIREADLIRWMAECQKAELIVLYENSGKKYLQIIDFKQRLDKAKNKFPLPTVNDFPETVNDFPPERETETEEEKETPVKLLWPTFEDFWAMYEKKVDRVACEKKWEKLNQKEKEAIMFHIPGYKKSQPDKQFRKNPETFLNNKSWENEIIIQEEKKEEQVKATGNF